MPRSLLFVELGSRPAREMRRGFPAEGFKVDTASGIAHAQSMAAMRDYSGAILFANSPDLLARCAHVLSRHVASDAAPVLCVADLSETDEIDVLEAGGSLCLPSAISFEALLSRVRALFEVAEGFPVHYRIHDLGIDPVARRASRAGTPLNLRPMEFDLLVYLAERAEKTVSWEELHRQFWPRREFSSARIAVQIHNLRHAIGMTRQAPLLHTVRSGGYLLSAQTPRRMHPAAQPRSSR